MAGSGLRGVLAGLAVVLLATAGLGLTYNTTPSLPLGVYRIRPLTSEPLRGQVVGFCLAEEAARLGLARGYVHPQGLEPIVYGTRCSSGAGIIGKPVAGIPGDTVEASTRGVLVNGRLLRSSRAQPRDRAGRALPSYQGKRILGTGEFWLQSEFAQNSFDSRIFGPVSAESILDRRVFAIGFGSLFCLTLTLTAGAVLVRRLRRAPAGPPPGPRPPSSPIP